VQAHEEKKIEELLEQKREEQRLRIEVKRSEQKNFTANVKINLFEYIIPIKQIINIPCIT
jgi:hypothetical protein